MPELYIVTMSQCENGFRGQNHKTGENGKYDTFFGHGTFPHCTCPAFKYSKGDMWEKTCKHIEAVKAETCDYHELVDGRPEVEGICPKCGGPTEYVKVGV